MRASVTLEGLDDVVLALEALPQQVRRAEHRAVRTTVRQTNKDVLRLLSKATGVPQKILKARRRVIPDNPRPAQKDRPRGSVWGGLYPIPAALVATRAQLARAATGKSGKGGIRIKGHRYANAFWMKAGDQVRVVRRVGRDRFPIEEVNIPIEVDPSQVGSVRGVIPERLQRAMRKELKFEVRVKGR